MMKRSSEYQYLNMNSNGNNMSVDFSSVTGAEAKKPRMEACNPSRVLHIRGVPNDASEDDVVQIGIPFGRMTNLVLARKKNQALLEMGDVSMAQAMFNYYHESPPQIKGRQVYIQYSNHQQLKTEQFLTGTSGAQNALKAASEYCSNTYTDSAAGFMKPPMGEMMTGGGGGGVAGSYVHSGGHAMAAMDSFIGDGGSKIVIRAVIENILYPINIDILHKVFSKYGQVAKIIVFSKDNVFQSLIQYTTAAEAQGAIQFLNNQNIYNGCCTLRIDYSKLQALNVRYNNEKSWDYTNPNLSSGDSHYAGDQAGDGILGAGTSGGPIAGNFGGMGGNFVGGNHGPEGGFNGPRMGGGGHLGMQRPGGYSGGMMPPAGGCGGSMGSGGNMGGPVGGGMGGGMAPMNSGMGQMGGYMVGPMNGGGMGPMSGGMGGQMGFGMRQMGPGMGQMGPGMERMGGPGMPLMGGMVGAQMGGCMGVGCVIIISGFEEERITPDFIYNLFGSYGVVIAVKILYNKKDTALVQYADPQQALNAITHLDHCTLWNKTLKVSQSKHTSIQLPREGQGDGSTTKDFTNSPLNRFKKVNNPKSLNITYPPSPTLHVGNMPPTTTEDDLRELFSEYGTIAQLQFLEKERKMALIQLASTEEAINALVGLHNHLLPGNFHLRVSFTKSTIRHVQ